MSQLRAYRYAVAVITEEIVWQNAFHLVVVFFLSRAQWWGAKVVEAEHQEEHSGAQKNNSTEDKDRDDIIMSYEIRT